MGGRPVVKVPVQHRDVWGANELGAMYNVSYSYIHAHLIDGNGNKVLVADAVEGNCWVLYEGSVRIPVRLNHNHHLWFYAPDVRAAFAAHGLALAERT